VAFGGSGPYIEKIKMRMMYNDLVVFDLEKNDYVKFDGDVTSLEETRVQKSLEELKLTTKGEFLLRLFKASKHHSARLEYPHWAQVRAGSSILAPKSRSFLAGCTVGCQFFVHGGYGRINSFRDGVLGDWGLFDLGLGVWIKIKVNGADKMPLILNRRMHTLTSVSDDKDCSR